MDILSDTVKLVKNRLGDEFESITVERLVMGIFFTGVKLSNQAAGICFTPIKHIPEAVCCPSSAGRAISPAKINGMKAMNLLANLSSGEPLKTATAIATLNALSATCFKKGLVSDCRLIINTDAKDAVDLSANRSVALVGALVPFLKVLKKRGGIWWVIEEDQRTLRSDEMAHFVPFEISGEIISKADVLVITGATIVNHTLETILDLAKPDAEVVVVGPTASMLPEPMFERGVSVVGGVLVKEPDKLLDILAAGGSGYHFLDTLAERVVFLR
ncbi:conserved hypothetical protein [uncultured Desulfobacterium sp.]|uniref:Fis family transcriptional regulator n=1 Tax=uncultured Desulfobacterium sp. TaxID=201089 RepID=A0A445MXB6_9BACT|nr:conserved hypothetical protein [uncultured Desulfobacterium sp.]